MWCASPDALKGSLIDTLKEVQPTIFLGVPRVWEKIMEEKSSQLTESKQFISNIAKKIGLQHIERGKKFHSLQWRLCHALVYSKVKKELGLSKCRLFFSGAAPISIDVVKYFVSLNIPIFDIFGMSESSGCISFNYNSRYKLGSSGVKLQQTEVCIDSFTSEIFTRGRHVMLGYLNNPEKTWETIDQNKWLHTGDIGYLDNEGFLHITGRIKELLITSGGENIPPLVVEENIKSELPIISNCMVVGDKRKYLTVLITLKCIFDTNNTPTDNLDHHTISVLARLGYNAKKVSELIDDPIFLDYIVEGIVRANERSISRAQQVKKFRILPFDFSIVGGELGPTMKLRRLKVIEKYRSLVDGMYDEDNK
jgi:long-chain-fatty-acid--CoA ligase ACSBG